MYTEMARIITVLLVFLLSVAHAQARFPRGSGQPGNVSIPTSSLAVTTFAANNWPGITSPAATVTNTGGFNWIKPTSFGAETTMATGTGSWRDQELTSFTTRGEMIIRLSGGNGIFMSIGVACAGCVRIGIVTGYSTPNTGTHYNTYIQDTPGSCITGWATDGSKQLTLGARGFNVYLLINGVQAIDTCQTTTLNPTGAIAYYEYRSQAMGVGSQTMWIHPGGSGARDIVMNYYPLTALNSAYASNSFDTRDFGMRTLSAFTGTISASSTTLALSAARDVRVGDRLIVELGGESGAGARNTIGVGGSSPELHYTNAAARTADTSKPDNTYAYIDTDGSVARSTGGVWATNPIGSYYTAVKAPVALIAVVTAVNGAPATSVTLDTAATVAATAANVYLDAQPSFYPATTNPAAVFANRNDSLTQYQNMTVSIPAGTYYVSGLASVMAISAGDRTGLTITGQGVSSTNLQSPKGVPSWLFDGGTANNTLIFQDFTYTGNWDWNGGYMWAYTGSNKNFPGDSPTAIVAGVSASNVLAQRIKCVNWALGCIVLSGTNPQILNPELSMTVGQKAYMQWGLNLTNCTGGKIEDITVTGAFLLKSAELFACNGATINRLTGTNALIGINSSTSSTVSNFTTTIAANSWFDATSGAIDEAIININQNAFGSGTSGTVSNARIIQSGYIDASNNSLKAIQIQSGQTGWTISGQYPGGGGCTTALNGFFQAPNYNGGSAEYGSMAIYSDAANTTATGLRVKGSAIGSPGLSGHYGNISLTGATSSAMNNVADVIQPGPTTSGNQTNAAYGGC